ncbi:putative leucyl/phenylalanyl-tRNA--protein transferase [Ilumatobacter coccineus YM16-304]|uniref:Putative leucyl/phenylalanyl-tRNA--protein transferase n=1 Tax=Ilumatobacter coccineus (strain NBRC 103263 / KCTC 29153 / YM16-304) TaxID=1313172 RepID=A0A6C7E9C6_ILUCY|nr:putative leucyl/phenylalanyl-tRNA--protein transferase [Ilumatobacter coccineus YM16-304]
MKIAIGHSGDADVAARRSIRRLREHLPIDGLDILPNHLQGLVLLGNTARDGGHEWQEYDRRAVISRASAHLPRSARRALRQTDLDIRITSDVEPIIRACRREWESWITEDLIDSYVDLANRGVCIGVGAYRDDDLVAGIWGLVVGRCFTGMSTFHTEPGAGTVVFAWLVNEVIEQRELVSIDVGEATPHVMNYGVYEISREDFLRYLQARLGTDQASAVELPAPPS